MSVLSYSQVATLEQSKNVAIAHLVGQLESEQLLMVRIMATAIIGTGSKFMPFPSAHY